MGDIIKARKGIKASIDTLLLAEFGFTTDEERVYIGGNNGNIPLPNAADLSEKAKDIDNTRTTTSKTVTGAINELNANKPTVETGTWTPVLKGSTVAGSNTYSQQTGRYIKQGKLITCFFRVSLSAKDANMSGNIQIGGLPYIASNSNANRAGLNISQTDNITFASGRTQLGGAIIVGDSNISVVSFGSGVIAFPIVDSQIIATSGIFGSITYETSV